jgi:hypothetical protein
MRRPLLPGSGPLTGVPPLVVFLVVAAVFAVGVVVGGLLGAALLGLLVVGVAVLLATTWAQRTPPERLARVVVLVVLAAVAIGVALR